MDAAFFIVLHLSRKGLASSCFSASKKYNLPCRIAVNGNIKRGVIYLALLMNITVTGNK
jgi:hypothetical protein